MATNHTHRRGFTLVEVIFWIGLIGVVLSTVSQLFRVSFNTIRETELAQTQAARIDHLLSALRRDVWGGRKLLVSAKELSVELSDRSVTWSIVDHQTAKRIEHRDGQPDDQQRWPDLPEMKFEKTPSGLALVVAGQRVDLANPMSQMEAVR